jgi:hypothetical protein
MPALANQIPSEDTDLLGARDKASKPMQEMVAGAQAEGTLRLDIAFADVGLLFTRLAQPLPGPIPRALNDRLAHRHLDMPLDGLRATDHSEQHRGHPGQVQQRAAMTAPAQIEGSQDVGEQDCAKEYDSLTDDATTAHGASPLDSRAAACSLLVVARCLVLPRPDWQPNIAA